MFILDGGQLIGVCRALQGGFSMTRQVLDARRRFKPKKLRISKNSGMKRVWKGY